MNAADHPLCAAERRRRGVHPFPHAHPKQRQRSATRRGLTPALKRLLRRRSAIEPEIGLMKADGRLSRCPLKGKFGTATFAFLCGCGHNICKILAHLKAILAFLIAALAMIMDA